jgi:hypothetical protein
MKEYMCVTVLKTGVKMIDIACMVHVYKIANEKVANMYYLKSNHGTCILSFSMIFDFFL